jgi:hypothetical protein
MFADGWNAMTGQSVNMTISAGNRKAVHAILDGLPDNRRVDFGAGVAVAEGAVGTVQIINVSV